MTATRTPARAKPLSHHTLPPCSGGPEPSAVCVLQTTDLSTHHAA